MEQAPEAAVEVLNLVLLQPRVMDKGQNPIPHLLDMPEELELLCAYVPQTEWNWEDNAEDRHA
eukprot:15670770-Heterocapsa_arctica.AAC.1